MEAGQTFAGQLSLEHEMPLLRSAILFSSAIGLASAVQAADLAAPVSDWTGFYAGLGVGGGFAFSEMAAQGRGAYEDLGIDGQDWNDLDTANFSGNFQCAADICQGITSVFGALNDDSGKAGFIGRAEIGADYQMDRIVAGVNASFTFGDRKTSSSGGGGGAGAYETTGPDEVVTGAGMGSVDSELELGNSWAVGARLGYLVTDSVLLFAAGGYTQANAKLSADFKGGGTAGIDETSRITGAYDISSSQDEWLGGYYVGGGLEALITEQFSLKVEYRYADYDSIETSSKASDITCDPDCYGWGTGVEAKADVSDHTVMATVSLRM